MTDPLEIERRYSYASVPTIKRFSQSRAFIRGLMGPFGSGKSSGCVMELVKWAARQPVQADRKRRARFACIRNCYDDQTEILTERRGWRLFKDLLESDRIAMLENGKLVFAQPTYYYSADYVGQMIGHRNEGVDFLVTPDHKLSVSMRNARRKTWSQYRLRTAAECFGKTNMRVRRSADWEGSTTLSADFFEWLGYWFAEGSTTVKEYDGSLRHNCVINTKNDRDYARQAFEKAGLPFTERERGDGVTTFRLRVTAETRPLILKLATCGKEITKTVPVEWKNAPREHLRRFLTGYLQGDGSHRSDSTVCASTASRTLADDLQEIALRAGEVMNIAKYARRDAMVINGVATRQNAGTYRLTFLRPKKHSPHLTAEGWYTQTYRGKVYCVEVPTHIVYIRRGGKAFWCSQTYGQLADTTIKTFLYWLPDRVFGTFNKGDHVYRLDNLEDLEVEILFRALDRPEHVANLLSLELTGAWVNEAREIPWAVIKALKGRVDRYPPRNDGGCVDPGIIMDTNPPEDDSWWYRLFEEKKADEDDAGSVAIFKQPSGRSAEAENLPNLSASCYQNLAVGMDPDFIRVYVDGLYGSIRDGKPVYPEYNDAMHCVEVEPVKGVAIARGWDFGLTPACVFTQALPDGRWIIFEELIGDDVGISTFADGVLQLCQRWPGFRFEDWGDPAGEQRSAMTADRDEKTCFDILQAKGIQIRGGEQNITARLESVRKPLNTLRNGKPQLQLHPRCQVLRKGFRGRYQFKRVKIAGSAERYHDVPDKNEYSHAHDALQYVATAVFGGVVRGREEGREGLKLPPLEQLSPEWARNYRRRVV